MVVINATESEALVDEEIGISVNELLPHQKITILATLNRDVGEAYQSYGHFTANPQGAVDLSKVESEGGSYTGIITMGLFCTMKPLKSNKYPFSRLVNRDVELPFEVAISVYDDHILAEEVIHKLSMSRIILRRWYKAPGVKRVPVHERHIRGSLFIPEGDGPFPAVVDLFGSAGGLMEFRAALLASRGFLALSLAIFAYDDLPDNILHFEMEYLEEAKNFLLAHKSAHKGGIGIIGVSTGGTLALAAASYIPEYCCCVSINGPIFTYYTALSYKGRMWKALFPDMRRVCVQDNGIVMKKTLDEYFNVAIDSDSIIEFDKSNSSFLFLFSEDDMAIDAIKHKDVAERLLHGSSGNHCIKVYPGAGHLLEPPFSPHSPVTFAKIFGFPQHWGGNTIAHSIAQAKAWDDLLQFLRIKLTSTRNAAKL